MRKTPLKTISLSGLVAVSVSLFSTSVVSAVLPEDRADILYHSYEGGGAEITGPSVLLRKQFAETISIWGNYYEDMVTNASIDVQSGGSTEGYTEDRTEYSAGMDYLHDKTIMSVSYTKSSENDYDAQTVGISVSQDFFGDLTTFSMNYSQGNDIVGNNTDNELPEEEQQQDPVVHQRYGINLTQILTKNWIVGLNAETVLDEGKSETGGLSPLANPYRSYHYLNTDGIRTSEKEKYPFTRNSDAVALRSMYYLPYRASVKLEYRTYSDSWGITASNYELRYIHPIGQRWILEAKYRYYSQTQAEFYSDLFSKADEFEFMGRDKELSTYSNTNTGLGVTYEINSNWIGFVDKMTINMFWDRMSFKYDNFRDSRQSIGPGDIEATSAAGEEELYAFDADVIRLFISVIY